jgi:hypothetical protein
MLGFAISAASSSGCTRPSEMVPMIFCARLTTARLASAALRAYECISVVYASTME